MSCERREREIEESLDRRVGEAGHSGGTSSFGGEEHLYRAFFRAGPDGVLFADAGGVVLDANEEACRLLGRGREELLAPGGGEIFDPSDPRLAAARGEQRRTGSFRGHLRVLRGSPGEAGAFEAVVTVAGYVDGFGEDRLVIVVREAEGHKRQDPEATRSAEEMFLAIASYVGDAVVVFEIDGSLRYVSPAMERVTGYAPEELVGFVMLDVIHPEDLERVVAESVEIWDSPGIAPPFVFRLRRKDDSWAHLEFAMNNLLEDERVGGVVVIIRDVTERVRAEEEVRRLNAELERRVAERTAELQAAVTRLKENEELFRATFEGAATGIALLSPDGRYLRANRRFCAITGHGGGELVGGDFRGTIHPEDASADEERRRGVAAGETADYSAEVRYLRRAGGPVWVSSNVSLVRDASGDPAYFILVVEDIDARKGAELALGSLTLREKEVLLRLARGETSQQISARLYISYNTVRSHVHNIIAKLGVENRTQAARRAIEFGLVSDDEAAPPPAPPPA
ncbi:MAG: Two-component transcriptional response regulator, LuxR family [uncultured Rubrobacteraceae bacterium]|uniref:Two-component transcriptional response regulator, LuxR family n=1 Tax=uncultured Rubrobacteraceae bacterium TaxID=349277 RepID=A0A6J4R617_9ACTN|nr:MAG: Two-component transcriptional response regulator, LuxR family [uncultured Rubrobacteraceae bacterium]